MQWTKTFVALGLAVAMMSVSAQAEIVSNAQLMEELNALRAKVATLESGQDAEWMNERRVEEVKALVREVLSDAETRASLMDSAITAGHNGKNFFLASEDGSFLMKIGGQIQFRYIANFRDDDDAAPADKVDEGEAGFVIRRTKVYFEGHIADPKLHYAIQLAVDRGDNTVVADKITIGYDLADDLHIWVGEDKAPFLKEELVSSKRQLAVERSYVSELFTVDKVQGVGLKWKATDNLKFAAMIHDGAHSGSGSTSDRFDKINDLISVQGGSGIDGGSSSKDFDDDGTDFAFAARVDWLIEGNWKQWKDFTSFPGEDMFAYAGAAINYEAGETGASGAAASFTDDVLTWTVDAGFEQDGLNLFAAYIGQQVDRDSAAADDFDPWALMVQGGYNFALDNGDSLEPFVRWEHIDLDGNVASATPNVDDEIDLITFGFNWYHKKHAAKFTADVVIATQAIGGSSGLGLAEDVSPGAGVDPDEQIAVRAQYQLTF